jgi:hypothetical protein
VLNQQLTDQQTTVLSTGKALINKQRQLCRALEIASDKKKTKIITLVRIWWHERAEYSESHLHDKLQHLPKVTTKNQRHITKPIAMEMKRMNAKLMKAIPNQNGLILKRLRVR